MDIFSHIGKTPRMRKENISTELLHSRIVFGLRSRKYVSSARVQPDDIPKYLYHFETQRAKRQEGRRKEREDEDDTISLQAKAFQVL